MAVAVPVISCVRYVAASAAENFCLAGGDRSPLRYLIVTVAPALAVPSESSCVWYTRD